jgi:hypothetical protein
VAAFLFLLVLCTGARAERVILDNGGIVIGEITEDTSEAIVVMTEDGEVRVPKQRIARIDARDRPRRNAIVLQYPLGTLLGPFLADQFSVLLEYQRVITDSVALHVNGMYAEDGWMSWSSVMAGPQFRPGGRGLAGFYAGLEGGAELRRGLIWGADLLLARLDGQVGYEWVGPRVLKLIWRVRRR